MPCCIFLCPPLIELRTGDLLTMKKIVLLGVAACALPAFGAVTVNAPQQNAKVVSPFWLSASATACSNQPIVSMGYSFGNSTNTTTFNGSSISTSASAPLGATILHVKSWGNQGANCTTDVNITIVPDPATTVPANATVASNLQDSTWKAPNAIPEPGSTILSINPAATTLRPVEPRLCRHRHL